MIILFAKSGLCNRMRVIDSLAAVGRDTKQKLLVVWSLDKCLDCRFEDIFEPIDGVRIWNLRHFEEIFRMVQRVAGLLKFIPGIKSISEGGIQRAGISKIREYIAGMAKDSVLFFVSSVSRIYNNSDKFKCFVPNEYMRECINKECETFDEHTVGLHIRRSDNQLSIEKSPLALFEKAIESEIEKDEAANFYLASDCTATKQYLAEKYGTRIKTDMTPAVRDSKKGVRRAVVELYALSRSKKVYGSYWSSFSQTAYQISGIEGIELTSP